MGNPIIILWLQLKTGTTNLWFVLGLILCACLSNTLEVDAQITPDSTLNNNSVVLPDDSVNLVEITEGTTTGNNLFHSFQEFSVPDGQTAFFNNESTIENIFSRITGGSVSNIDGIIRANGAANLFLINPNGIVFGENATLNIGGSFISSTADSIQFSDGSFYSAVDPQAPSLLEVNIPIGLQYGAGAGNIIVQGNGNNTGFRDPSVNDYSLVKDFRPSGLQVDEGNSLALIGGNIALDGGNLTAAEGHIELGSVSEGSVKLDSDGGVWTFDYQDAAGFQDIALANAASVEVSGNSSGTVNVQGQNITLTDASAILSNTSGDGTAGSITLNGTESVQVTGVSQNNIPFVSYVSTDNTADSTGAGADLTIDTNYLLVAGGAQIASAVFGSGQGGTLNVNAEGVELISGSPVAGPSGLFAPIVPGATGAGGDINLKTNSLLVAGGAQAYTLPISSSQGGNFNIQAQDIELTGTSPNGSPSGLFTSTFADGDGGNLTIDTSNLLIANGAEIASNVIGSGNAGKIDIKADTIDLNGLSEQGIPSIISASVQNGASGIGGDITIETDSLRLTDGAQINSSVFGVGDGGNLSITANEIDLVGFSPADNRPTSLFATVNPGSIGNSGNLTIATDNLRVSEGAQIAVSTGGSGSAGNLSLTASDSVELTGNAIANGGGSSGLFSNAVFGDGNGGNIDLTTDRLSIKDGATINVGNFLSVSTNAPPGTGQAGNISINADTIELDGVDRDTPASITASTFAGGGGNIVLNSDTITTKNGGQITSETQGDGDGGNIELTADTLELNSGGRFSTNTAAGGNAGSVNLTIDQANFNGAGSGVFSEVQETATGDGGSVMISADEFNLNNQGQVSVNSTGLGQGGDIAIASDSLNLNQGQITATSVQTGGGEINLATDSLSLDNNSLISTSVLDSTGGGGNIVIDNSGLIIGRNNSNIEANAVFGQGGNIQITSQGLFFDASSKITASSEFGVDGIVEINGLELNKRLDTVQLPQSISPPEAVIISSCPVPEQSTFAVTGLGGIPENPGSYLRGRTLWQDARRLISSSSESNQIPPNNGSNSKQKATSNNKIIESQGWIINQQGNVELVAAAVPKIGQHGIKCGDL